MATLANDQLAEACRRHPGRFSGLTAVAPQDPEGVPEEVTMQDELAVGAGAKKAFFQGIAEEVFGL